jgi:hypothetical protein
MDVDGPDAAKGRFLAELLRDCLGEFTEFDVLSCASVRRALADLGAGSGSELIPAQYSRLAQVTGSSYLLAASFWESDKRLTLTARLIDATSGKPVPGATESTSGDAADLLARAQDLSGKLRPLVARPAAANTLQPAPAPETLPTPVAGTLLPPVPGTLPAPAPEGAPAAPVEPPRPYTGLIVDASQLTLARDPSPRIRTAAVHSLERVLYPDPRHLLNAEEIQDRGMVRYATTMQDAEKHAGANPLVVRAVAVAGVASQDLIVSPSDGEAIRQADRDARFTEGHMVVFLKAP